MKNSGDPARRSASDTRTTVGCQIYDALRALPDNGKLSERQLEAVYAIAYAHLAQHKYDRALPAFAFLVQYDPTCRHYLTGLGLCLQHGNRHDDAVHIYAVVIALYPDASDVLFHLVESQLALGRRAIAREYLSILSQCDCADHPQTQPLTEVARRARALLALLDNGKQSAPTQTGTAHPAREQSRQQPNGHEQTGADHASK